MYSIKEIFYTLQGEGAQAGRAAVFCRFSKCNLWNGREADRAGAACQFCDTDFVGTDGLNGGRYENAAALAERIEALWPDGKGEPYVVCTGGEPLLQLDEALIRALQARGFMVGVESNGTLPVPEGIDWLCISPKAGSRVVVESCDELKLVFPQSGLDPENYLSIRASHYFLSPRADARWQSGPDVIRDASTRAVLRYCLAHPRWRMTQQMHKLAGFD